MDKLHQMTKYFALEGDTILLESQSKSHPASRISYLAANPQASIKVHGNAITITANGKEKTTYGNPWEVLKAFRDEHQGWLFGFLGYDLKNHIEQLHSNNPDSVKAPDMYFMIPGFLLRYDHRAQRQEVLVGQYPNQKELAHISTTKNRFSLEGLQLQTSQSAYLQKITEAQHSITDGDFYEVNLSHQMQAHFEGTPFGLYQKMGKTGSVPFGGYLKLGDLHICSQSPERFLRRQGDRVYSQPIKGTSRRGKTMEEDETLKQTLLSSQKERAENLMIVDLVRNDLSKIAQKGTVKVPQLFEIQSFDTVHQLVSTIEAKTSEDDPVDVLKACFPMGSMTGAPKISAMKAIEKLEDYKRGVYSGAIGYISPNGDFDFNVVIRTAIVTNNQLFYSTGGAVTGDSDPQKEWEETQIKARALLDAAEYSQKI
ncbi:MAG: aminodeoxychorismate synthase component I [Bacteroidota bacterium]